MKPECVLEVELSDSDPLYDCFQLKQISEMNNNKLQFNVCPRNKTINPKSKTINPVLINHYNPKGCIIL